MGGKKTVDDAVLEYPVLVFSKSYCPYCARAKAALTAAGAEGYKVYELDRMGGSGKSIQNYIRDTYAHSTVPAVFVGGELIGGGDDTAKLQREGKLAAKLATAVAKAKEQESARA